MENLTAQIKNQGIIATVFPENSDRGSVEFLIQVSGGLVQPLSDMRLTVRRDNGVSSSPTPNPGLTKYLEALTASREVDVDEFSAELIELCQEEAQRN